MKIIIPLILLFNVYAININDTNYNTDTRSFENISEVNTLGKDKLFFSISGNFNGDPYYTDRNISRSQNLELKAQYGFSDNIDFGIGIGVNQLEENLIKSTQMRDIILDSKIQIFDRLSLIPQLIIPTGNNELVNNKNITYGGKLASDFEVGEQIFYQNVGYLMSSGNQYNQINQNSQFFASLGHKLNINKIVYLGNEILYYSNDSENLIGFQPHFNISNGNFNIRAGLEFYNKRKENGAFVTLNIPFDRLLDQAPVLFQESNAPEIPFQFTYKQVKEEKEQIDEKALKEELKKELKEELKEELLKEVQKEVDYNNKKLQEMRDKQEKVYHIQKRLNDSIEVLQKYHDMYSNNQISDKDAQREIRWGLRVVKLRRKYLNKLVNDYKEKNYKEKLEQLGDYQVPKEVEKLAKKVLKDLKHKSTDINKQNSSIVQITNSNKNNIKKKDVKPISKKTNIVIQKNSEEIAKEQKRVWEDFKNRNPIKNDLTIKKNRPSLQKNNKKEKIQKQEENKIVQEIKVEKVIIPKIKKIDLKSEIKPIKIDQKKERNLFKHFFEKTKTKLEKQDNGLAKELNKFYNQYKAKIQLNKDNSTTVKTEKATVTFKNNKKKLKNNINASDNQSKTIERESLNDKLEEVYKDYEIISIQESQDDIVPENGVGEDGFIQKNTGPQF